MLTSDGKKSIIIISILTPLSTIFLGLRLAKKLKLLGLDDWLLCFAVLLLWLQNVGNYLLATKGGEGRNLDELTPDEITWLGKMEYWPELGYTVCVATIKISVLLSYNRIFGRLKWFRYSLITFGTMTSVWFLGVFFSVMFQCTPIDKAWNPMKPGHCIALKPFLWGNSISNTVLDYGILLLPVVPVLKLQMAPVQKMLVLASFSLGSLASVSSTMRAVNTSTVNEANISGWSLPTVALVSKFLNILESRLTETVATIFKDAIWTYIEPNAGVISACLPYLANIFGQSLAKALKFISTLAYRTSLLLRSHGANDSTNSTYTSKRGTQRATYEGYELNENGHQDLPRSKNKRVSQDSVRNLV